MPSSKGSAESANEDYRAQTIERATAAISATRPPAKEGTRQRFRRYAEAAVDGSGLLADYVGAVDRVSELAAELRDMKVDRDRWRHEFETERAKVKRLSTTTRGQ